ncbi:MAG: acyltransferase [Achromobacter sp.]|nr:acyltransferase [Achromobacter sp.]
MSATTRSERNFGLDVLRAAAIVAVLVFHGDLGFFISTGLSQWQGWRAALSVCAGVLALEWFFVLSGYLIGSILIRSFEARDRWWDSTRTFWLRRWFRTLPNYYLFLLVNALLAWAGIEQGRFSASFLVFAQSLVSAQEKPFFFAESWSLAVEEWFYLLIPCVLGLLALVVRGRRQRLFWAAAGLLIAVPMVLRTLAVPPAHFFEWDENVRRVTVMHLDSIGWGVVAAIVGRWHPAAWARHQGAKAVLGLLLTLAGVAGLFYFMVVDWRGFAGGRFNDLALITAPALGTALMLPWLAGLCVGSAAVRRLAARLADYSYSMYLCHYPLMLVVLHAVKAQGWQAGPIVGWLLLAWLALVLGVSALVFRCFERPMTRLRERFTRHVPAGPFAAPALGARDP